MIKKKVIKRCSESDIDFHFSFIDKYINENKDEVIDQMFKAVSEKTAYMVEDDNCFLYFIDIGKKCADCVALYGKGNPLSVLWLFYEVFKIYHKNIFKLRLLPHNGINDFKSIVEKSSIRNWHNYKTPLVIRTDRLAEKLIKYYDL